MSKIIPAKERKKIARGNLYNSIIGLEEMGFDHSEIKTIMKCKFNQDVTNSKMPSFAMSEKRAVKLNENIVEFLQKRNDEQEKILAPNKE